MKKCILLLVSLLCVGCFANEVEEKDVLFEDGKYIEVRSEIEKDKASYYFYVLDENLETLQSEILELDSDISYHAHYPQTNAYYLFGDGGLFEVKDNTLSKMSEEAIHQVRFDEEGKVYGFVNDPKEGKDGIKQYKIIDLDNMEFLIGKYVCDFYIMNEMLYVLCEEEGNYFLQVWNKEGILVEENNVTEIGCLFASDGVLYLLTTKGVYDVKAKECVYTGVTLQASNATVLTYGNHILLPYKDNGHAFYDVEINNGRFSLQDVITLRDQDGLLSKTYVKKDKQLVAVLDRFVCIVNLETKEQTILAMPHIEYPLSDVIVF